LNNDEFQKSVFHLEKSNKMFWNNPEVLRNLGWAYVMTNQVERWIAILQRALKLSPWDRLIIEDLAMALIWIWEVEKWNKLLKEIWSDRIVEANNFKLR
jgi:Flp pilus assembly protein TadD